MSEERPQPASPEIRSTLAAVAAALGWVVLSSISILVSGVVLLTVFSLARSANTATHSAWLWLLAVVVTLIVPILLAAWKHFDRPRELKAAMTWLPSVWNGGALMIAILLVPDLVGTALRSCEWVVQGRFGDAHAATRALSAFGHEAAELVDPGGATLPQPTVETARFARDGDIVVPFTEQAAIFLSVELEGTAGQSMQLEYLFDTGASYTTITSQTARELGIEVPDDAPSLEFNTASGLRESRMVHLPALWLGEVRIPGLLVSVCDACATERTGGLLGLNVMREFLVQIDYQGSHMRLLPRVHENRPNRSYDIGPVLSMQVEGRPEIWLGRVRWVVTLTNHGMVAVEDAMPRVDFKNGTQLYGERVARIEPGETGRSLLVGRVVEEGEDTGSIEFTLMLVEAYW